MAAQHRSLTEFNPENNCITLYLERASPYFIANDVAEEKQVAIPLSSIGPPPCALLSDLFAQEKPSSKTFKQISQVLANHYKAQQGIIAERFHFYKRDQASRRVDCRI